MKAINPIRFPLFGNIMTRSNIVDVRIVGKNYTTVDDLVKQIMEIGKDTKGVIFRYTDLYLNKPEVEVRVDPERAAHFGFDVKDIADAVESHIGGQRISRNTMWKVVITMSELWVLKQISRLSTMFPA